MTQMANEWKVTVRDYFGKVILLEFFDDMTEGKRLQAYIKDEFHMENQKGEVALTAVHPDWLPNPTPEDYKDYVRSLITDEEWKRVIFTDDKQLWYDIELGDMREYFLLAKVIPKDFTVIDFGCGTNAQSYLFMQHRHYYAVDVGRQMFWAPGTSRFRMTTGDFIRHEMPRLKLDMHRTFAICSNVTGKDNENPGMLVRMNFLNMYTINNSILSIENENHK